GPFGGREVEERRRPADPGVIDEHVDPAELLLGCLEERGDVGLLADVAGHAVRLAEAPELLERPIELGLVAPADENPGTFLEEPPRGGQSDAARAATDEHPLTGQSTHLIAPTRVRRWGRRIATGQVA